MRKDHAWQCVTECYSSAIPSPEAFLAGPQLEASLARFRHPCVRGPRIEGSLTNGFTLPSLDMPKKYRQVNRFNSWSQMPLCTSAWVFRWNEYHPAHKLEWSEFVDFHLIISLEPQALWLGKKGRAEMGCTRYYAVEYRKSTRNPLCPVLNSATFGHFVAWRSQ